MRRHAMLLTLRHIFSQLYTPLLFFLRCALPIAACAIAMMLPHYFIAAAFDAASRLLTRRYMLPLDAAMPFLYAPPPCRFDA